ncbi:MAG: molybdenum cofactor guanylyltransferase MobA [Methylotenera sp.]|nr:molybdenum cofactor guanylyltransferase MobA [Methylotenera sp.]MDO9233198.1 molybdenum cofactor guanylyltransferase MobA [Methylotenera sp.]MDO9388153.1 molybdenum cofactor guanylyltransferase MobA [Methylotenera sp.]MDP2103028.1 molybdenum cofactor guanylyltransferase MobA [Methylotenera sp.]MDP2281539.1 molybdenum cofactor guanylyltransferase MobA [Methylotenera sp.]
MSISAIILAGGRATRMGGLDKGLVQLQQKPLIQHVIKRLKPQVDEIIINANREIKQYQSLGYPVLCDEQADFIGPLAGFSLVLKHAKHDHLLTVPCDSPLLPPDLAKRLMQGLVENNADIAVAKSDGNVHPVFSLCKKNVLPSLTAYIANGERRVSAWQKSQKYIEVDFTDAADAFINLNTFEDLSSLELKLPN